METLITLLGTFAAALIILKISRKKYEFALAGRIAMAAMLVLTALGHVLFTDGMALMIRFLPFNREIVYLTGLIELAAAVGLLLPQFKLRTAWFLIFFFIVLLPANIYQAIHHINLATATFDGAGLSYLWFRIPLQVLFIVWIYYSTIRKPNSAEATRASLS